MGYRIGIGAGMAALGYAPRDPEFFCDGCGVVGGFQRPSGQPYEWFFAKKAKPGWTKVDGKDYCPRCKGKKP